MAAEIKRPWNQLHPGARSPEWHPQRREHNMQSTQKIQTTYSPDYRTQSVFPCIMPPPEQKVNQSQTHHTSQLPPFSTVCVHVVLNPLLLLPVGLRCVKAERRELGDLPAAPTVQREALPTADGLLTPVNTGPFNSTAQMPAPWKSSVLALLHNMDGIT